jgi:hypothetical protein
MPSTAEESIPELLARLEREHKREEGETFEDEEFTNGPWCNSYDHDAPPVEWPCDLARVVAHARSLEAAKDGAYRERDSLVAALSKLFPATLGWHEGEDWDDDWRNIVYIDLPTGQASWHLHESEMPQFMHLTLSDVKWDGHTTEEKYERVAALGEAQ